MLVIGQDHCNFVNAAPGTCELTEDAVGSRFAFALFRTFVDAGDPVDRAGGPSRNRKYAMARRRPSPDRTDPLVGAVQSR